MEFKEINWTKWKKNPLIILPQTQLLTVQLNLHFSSRVYYLDTDLTLFEVYKTRLEDSMMVKLPVVKLNAPSSHISIWDRRTNLSSVHLTVMYFNSYPFVNVSEDPFKIEGFFGEIFSLLQDKLQFQFTLSQLTDDQGNRLRNQTYNGITKELEAGRANWSIMNVMVSEGRKEALDFSRPVYYNLKRIVTRRPVDDFAWSAYLGVFATNFWIVLIISAAILVICLFLVFKASSHGSSNNNNSSSLTTALWYTFLCLCNREVCDVGTKMSGNILKLVILLWGFMVSCSFNAILTSVLSTPNEIELIKNFEDLFNSGKYSPLLKASGSITNYFNESAKESTGKQQEQQKLMVKEDIQLFKDHVH